MIIRKLRSGVLMSTWRILVVLFHKDFPLAVSSPNTVYYLMSYNNQLPAIPAK